MDVGGWTFGSISSEMSFATNMCVREFGQTDYTEKTTDGRGIVLLQERNA